MKMSAIHDSGISPSRNWTRRLRGDAWRLPYCLGTFSGAAHIDPRAQAECVREFLRPIVRDRLVQHLARSDDSLTNNAGPLTSRFPDAHHLRCPGECSALEPFADFEMKGLLTDVCRVHVMHCFQGGPPHLARR